MFRLGVHTGSMQISMLEYTGDPFSIDTYVAQLAMLRDEGFARVWSTQLPYERDLLTALAVAFREVPDIGVGTGVLPIQNQHPMLMAQRVLTLNAIAGGRFTLGIGMTHAAVTEGMWGISWGKPIRRMNEYLDGLLPLLNGEPADATGELVTTRGSVMIPDAPAPDVYIAALGPQMLAGGPQDRRDGDVDDRAADVGIPRWSCDPFCCRRSGEKGSGSGGATDQCHRRCGRRARDRGQAVCDVRPAAVLPGDAGSGRFRGAGGRSADRLGVRGVRATGRAA